MHTCSNSKHEPCVSPALSPLPPPPLTPPPPPPGVPVAGIAGCRVTPRSPLTLLQGRQQVLLDAPRPSPANRGEERPGRGGGGGGHLADLCVALFIKLSLVS